MSVLSTVLLLCFAVAFTSAQLNIVEKLDCDTNGPTANFYLVTDTSDTLITNGSLLNPNATTYLVIHGWMTHYKQLEYSAMARDINAETKGNVILVDYKELAEDFYLTCAWSIVKQLGKVVTEFVVQETKAGSMHPSRIYIIGHSLGGQTAGYVGRHVQKQIPGTKIKRISALDPAGPYFTLGVVALPLVSLSAKDAEMVDVLHTSLVLGSYARMGTVDFYATGLLGLTTHFAPCGILSDISCRHSFSKTIFGESITSCGFVGRPVGIFIKADENIVYGFHMPSNVTGIYKFAVNPKPPYAKGAKTC